MLCQFLDGNVGFLHQLEDVSIFAVLPVVALSSVRIFGREH